ncbi:hypothetical protein AGOR_G00106190 [Albula goreensis]|uniref:Kinesin-like protein KIF26A/B helical domain-containing protein n=1 Tax=Albula goreensis TaxID=1534307 RepID=A0A8T3DD95_9TELE|nr:hypothetical protein AGOR_G00106190 [Albula goreensis]
MALQNSSGSSGAGKPNPSLIDLGTFFVDSDIIFGFTSHLLRRKTKVEGCPSRESPFSLDLNPRKRLYSAEEALCGSRPPPEGAGSVTISESGHFERRDVKGNLCKQCQMKIAELKRQALALADPQSLKDPGFAAFLFDKLQVPEYPPRGRHEGGSRCEICATPIHQLRQQALQMILALAKEMPDLPPSALSGLPPRPAAHRVVTLSSSRDWAMPATGKQPPKAHTILSAGERRRGLGWQQGVSTGPKSSVQVTVGTGPLTSTLSSVTIQAQQYLEGMWSISRVNNFLPQPCLTQSLTPEAEWGSVAPEAPSVPSMSVSSCLPPVPQESPVVPSTQSTIGPPASSHGASAAASFFIR